jgi:tetratricopeptide (TPR) repeat protein
VLAARGALEEAIAAYDAALRAAPRLASAQYNRALALAARDDPAGAEAALRAELEVQPNWPPALIRLAALLAADGATGRVEAARLADQAAASLGDDDPDVEAVRRLVSRPAVSVDSP